MVEAQNPREGILVEVQIQEVAHHFRRFLEVDGQKVVVEGEVDVLSFLGMRKSCRVELGRYLEGSQQCLACIPSFPLGEALCGVQGSYGGRFLGCPCIQIA